MRLLVMLALLMATSAAWAQTVIVRSLPLRMTIPRGEAYSNAASLTITIADLVEGVDTVNLAVTGTLPPGTFTSLSTNSFSSNGTFASLLVWTNPAVATAGSYDVAVEATGSASYRLPIPVQVAYVWGGANVTNSAITNWNSAGNWQGGVVPGTLDTAVFGDDGGQAAASGPTNANVIISANTEVAALRFASVSNATRAHNIEIKNDATLRVSGPGLAFSMLRDSKNIGNQLLATFFGNGSLVVSNPAASIGVLNDNAQTTTWDMRNLDRFEADVVRIGLGDFRVYPNYETNGYVSLSSAVNGRPSRFAPNVWLAKTNIIKCSWVDPDDYNNGGIRNYALSIANSEAGSNVNPRYSLGLYNEFYLDSILWGGARYGGQANNYNFNSTNSYARFRGIGGGRMSVWAQADASGPNESGSNVRSRDANFSNGQVDALIDRLYLTRTSTNASGHTLQATLIIGGNYPGTSFDVNTAYIGNQDVTNIHPQADIEVRGFGNTFGNLVVNSNAIFKVNGDLHLAYTVAGSAGLPDQPETVRGLLNINNSGVVMANNIIASPFSSSEIVMTGGGNLIVTNGMGDSELPVAILNMNASSLTLHVSDAGVTNLFVKALTTVGANIINIGSVPTFPVYPTNITLISFQSGSGNFVKGSSPAGLNVGVQNLANSVIITLDTSAPQELTWTGQQNSNWDFASLNWKTSGGISTNFNSGDFVRFDDSTTSTTINVVMDVAPGQSVETPGMIVSNITQTYTFTAAGGSVQGSTLIKQGSGTAVLNATFNSSIEIEGGSLASSAVVGSVSVGSDASYLSSGTINGALASAGIAVNSGTATIGPLAVLSGGVITNTGSLGSQGTPGAITLQTNATLVNANSGVIYLGSQATIPSSSTLENEGEINLMGNVPSPGLTINGALKGSGVFERFPATIGNWPVNISGTFYPGSSVGTVRFYTRLNLNSGTRTTFEVDVVGGVNDLVVADTLNFGQANNPAILVMTNITGSFALGQAFQLFTNSFGDPFIPLAGNNDWNPANNAFQMSPISPGVGMRWDTSDVRTNGIVRIAAVSTVPPDIAALGPLTLINTTYTTNTETMVITTNMSTNTVFSLSWPETNLGYRLEFQTNALSVGLQTDPTNWTTWPNSWNVSQTNIPFNINNPMMLFRLVNP